MNYDNQINIQTIYNDIPSMKFFQAINITKNENKN